MIIENVADRLAVVIKKSNPEKTASVAVLKYGLIIFLNFMTTVGLALIIGLIIGNIGEVAIALIAFLILRTFSGGVHFNTALQCTIVSSLVIVTTTLPNLSPIGILIANIISCILILVYAPSRLEKQSNFPKKYYPALKLLSLLIVSANFLVQSEVLSLVFLVQSISLIRYES
jgi:accessory gene regulator B